MNTIHIAPDINGLVARTHNPYGTSAPVNGSDTYYEIHRSGWRVVQLRSGLTTSDVCFRNDAAVPCASQSHGK